MISFWLPSVASGTNHEHARFARIPQREWREKGERGREREGERKREKERGREREREGERNKEERDGAREIERERERERDAIYTGQLL